MTKYLAAFVVIIFLTNTAQAQFNATIRSDRPGQSVGPFSVGKCVFQTETGLDFGGFNEKQGNFLGNSFAPNTILRFGITEAFEINAAFTYSYAEYTRNDVSFSTSGLSVSSVGSRVNIYEGKNYIPAIGLQLSLKLPVLSADYDQQYIAPQILLVISEPISDKFSFSLNTGLDYNGNEAEPTGVYMANLGYTISAKWSAYIENYANFTRDTFENRWDTGLAYLLNDNLQLDVYGGIGKNDGVFDYFTSIGISWRTIASRDKN